MSKEEVGVPSCLLLDADASLLGKRIEQERLGKQIPPGQSGVAKMAGCAVCATRFVIEAPGPDFDLEVNGTGVLCTEPTVQEDTNRSTAKRGDVVARAKGIPRRKVGQIASGSDWS